MEKIIEEIWTSEKVRTGLIVIGVLIVGYLSLRVACHIVKNLRLYFFSQLQCCEVDYVERYGKWVVVSGATAGIGLAFAREFAKRGHSIIVIGIFDNELTEAEESLSQEKNVGQVLVIKCDLSDSSLENFENLRQQIDPDSRDIGILVNNVGIFPAVLKRVHKHDISFLKKIVSINLLAGVFLTRLILPGMVERGKGLVVNVSSGFHEASGCYFGLYNPTKNFVNSFTRQLEIEYYNYPIDFVLLTPGPVATNIMVNSKQFDGNSLVAPSQTFVKSVVNALSTRISPICGLYTHELLRNTTTISVPTWIPGKLGALPFVLMGIPVNISPVTRRKQRKVQGGC